MTRTRIHPAWFVAVTAFVALLGSAGFRAAPGALFVPLHHEFGWSTSVMSAAVSINLVLYGLTAPFAAALMDRFGIRQVTSTALVLIALGSGLTVFMTESWQLLLTWGLLIGLGTGSMALVFAATVANRWFIERRGLVMGILTAGSATGQLIFLPPVAYLAENVGWRTASLVIAGAALAVVPLVLLMLGDRPEDRGLHPYGAPDGYVAPPLATGGAARRAVRRPARRDARALVLGARGGVRHLRCHDERTDRHPLHPVGPRPRHVADHGRRPARRRRDLRHHRHDRLGLSHRPNRPAIPPGGLLRVPRVGLMLLPSLLSDAIHPSIVLFVVVYGLDWVATVPPTAALCREIFGESGTIVFGWVFASHQLGAAAAALAAGIVRDTTGSYTLAWVGGAGLCAVAAVLSYVVRKPDVTTPSVQPAQM